MQHLEYQKANDPAYAAMHDQAEAQLQAYVASHSNLRSSSASAIYTIPVVVHVVYRTTGQNISDAQIQSQIDVLNEDFGRTNPDTVNTPVPFQSIAAATNFQFCLARRDPSGNLTNGIERRSTTTTSWSTNDNVKHYSNGGLDAWDVNQYLNIWVCSIGGGILGYGEFPGTVHTNTYGVVIIFNSFGRVGLVSPPYNEGRTCTHEISHCFNLYHIWGDDAGTCGGSDQVADTPNQTDATYGCYTFPHTDACSASSPGIMYMNYMDYSDDACLNMFTRLQASRMYNSIHAYYPSLLSSSACQLPDGIDEDALSNLTFSVYPNPSEGMINLDMFSSNIFSEKITVRVLNTMGQIVLEQDITNPVGQVYPLDLTGQPGGIYLVNVSDKDHSRTVRVSIEK